MFDVKELFAQHAAWLPLFIFCARVCDMSLDTFRMICVVRGMRVLAAIAGFFQVIIWLTAVSSVLTHMDRALNVVAYAAGFATGNWVGMWLENKVALGHQMVRMISRDTDLSLAGRLRERGYLVTEVQGQGRDAPVTICFVAALRKDVPDLLRKARHIDPDVFVTVEDVRDTSFQTYHQLDREHSWLDTLAGRRRPIGVPVAVPREVELEELRT